MTNDNQEDYKHTWKLVGNDIGESLYGISPTVVKMVGGCCFLELRNTGHCLLIEKVTVGVSYMFRDPIGQSLRAFGVGCLRGHFNSLHGI